MQQENKRNRDYVIHTARNVTKKLYYDDIMFIEMCYREFVIQTESDSIAIRGSSADLKKYIESRSEFYICHSYLAINMKNVVSMEDGNITFINGKSKHIGEKNFRKARAVFGKYANGVRDLS